MEKTLIDLVCGHISNMCVVEELDIIETTWRKFGIMTTGVNEVGRLPLETYD